MLLFTMFTKLLCYYVVLIPSLPRLGVNLYSPPSFVTIYLFLLCNHLYPYSTICHMFGNMETPGSCCVLVSEQGPIDGRNAFICIRYQHELHYHAPHGYTYIVSIVVS